MQYAGAGARVIGCDVNPARVEQVQKAQCPFRDEDELPERLSAAVDAGLLTATTDTAAAVREADVAVVIVPLAAGDDHRPDFSIMESAVGDVARGAHPGLTVCFETTLPVGTTRRFGGHIAASAGLEIGVDLGVAFSPERVFSGRTFRDLATYPKLVGGLDAASAEQAASFYRRVLPGVEVRIMGSAEAAEMAKLTETIYRDVNIALANELGRFAAERAIDITEVIAAANSQPFSHVHAPGAGVGGHCIPHYPWFLVSDDPGAKLILTARRVNEEQPGWLLDRLSERLAGLDGRSVLVLGLSYRAGVKEPTSSAGIELVRLLLERGAKTFAHDPLFSDEEIRRYGATPAGLGELASFDAVIVQATHEEYRAIDWGTLRPGAVLVDGRNALERAPIEAAGVVYLGVGR